MLIHQIKPSANAKKSRRIGRGNGSKRGNYSGRGMKGQKARTGGNIKPGFEGGQTPLKRKLPKLKGFKNLNQIKYRAINIGDLNVFEEGSEVTVETLIHKGLLTKKEPVKILGDGKLEKKLTVNIPHLSKSAREKIEKSGGSILSPSSKK